MCSDNATSRHCSITREERSSSGDSSSDHSLHGRFTPPTLSFALILMEETCGNRCVAPSRSISQQFQDICDHIDCIAKCLSEEMKTQRMINEKLMKNIESMEARISTLRQTKSSAKTPLQRQLQFSQGESIVTSCAIDHLSSTVHFSNAMIN